MLIRSYFKKILIKLLGNDIYQPESMDVKKMEDWFYLSFKDRGFQSYYTMRKKYLINLLSVGIEGKEQYKALGRLEELKALASNVNSEGKRRKQKLENQKA